MKQQKTIYECAGCGRVTLDPDKDLALLRRAGAISCCPDRNMAPMELQKQLTAAEDHRERAIKAQAKADQYCRELAGVRDELEYTQKGLAEWRAECLEAQAELEKVKEIASAIAAKARFYKQVASLETAREVCDSILGKCASIALRGKARVTSAVTGVGANKTADEERL